MGINGLPHEFPKTDFLLPIEHIRQARRHRNPFTRATIEKHTSLHPVTWVFDSIFRFGLAKHPLPQRQGRMRLKKSTKIHGRDRIAQVAFQHAANCAFCAPPPHIQAKSFFQTGDPADCSCLDQTGIPNRVRLREAKCAHIVNDAVTLQAKLHPRPTPDFRWNDVFTGEFAFVFRNDLRCFAEINALIAHAGSIPRISKATTPRS